MNETLVTLMGNVATTPVYRETGSGSVVRFRLAATSRRWDRGRGLWADGHTNFFTVWAWRNLGANVVASVALGEPLVVQGRLKVRHEEREGRRWMSADVEAVAIGHDLSRGTAAFRRSPRGRPTMMADSAGHVGPHVPSVPESDPVFAPDEREIREAQGAGQQRVPRSGATGPQPDLPDGAGRLRPVPPSGEGTGELPQALFEVETVDVRA
ncbi:Single-stranded DNA-binding protein 1 [Streptomyces sp. YIM 130001]|uniref:single-stranded DNA-binding protein n=1 Tax=Streptomyces sp. YIM 130001 TaxID=2259644 RepID=UPI000E64C083|nr:single-stranded DNA-binding protein [Streptomyces sp. YIM 130001]RII19532.1 Single-stranded DNA-binding protein 1 [Streptomyces sp. YIM 130001]